MKKGAQSKKDTEFLKNMGCTSAEPRHVIVSLKK